MTFFVDYLWTYREKKAIYKACPQNLNKIQECKSFTLNRKKSFDILFLLIKLCFCRNWKET